ncbi:MAG TPA: chemotaxis protein CheX [Bryobacteraceae bacterium]|nr:chemotaxis protein CheX [Bryobacteraceae bacterium]
MKSTITHDEMASAICNATTEVFTTMLGTEVTPGELRLSKTAGAAQSGVVAVLGLAGDWVGSGSLSCEPELACFLAGQLLMAEYAVIDEEVLDAVAEVANMIVGNIKTMLEDTLGPMGLSTPTVIFGRNFETRSVGNRDWVIVPFGCNEHTMEVQLSLAPNTGRSVRMSPGFPIEHEVAF